MNNAEHAQLILEDGTIFQGEKLGADSDAFGEIVFNTSMTGYQEMLTDPSYGGQILVLTYPIVGNYGINEFDWESKKIQVRGVVVRQDCLNPSHPDMRNTIDEYLKAQDIPGISGVDTRAVTRRLRTRGVMMGAITRSGDLCNSKKMIELQPRYGDEDVVTQVTTSETYEWTGMGDSKTSVNPRQDVSKRLRIVVYDLGVKFNILKSLYVRGCEVVVVPSHASPEKIISMRPDGVLLSPGPGDPEMLDDVVQTVRRLAGDVPIMGICLGHQVVALAFGGKTFKLPFGHRGGNHSVLEKSTGRVYITAQNHGYAVSDIRLPQELEITHIDLSDGTIEGLRHRTLPIMTIQYHSEASPGPLDNGYLFDRFIEMVRESM